MKVCTKCKEKKTFTEFYKNRSEKDGLCYQCKVCTAAYRKEQDKKYKERQAAYNKKYSQKNKAKKAEYNKEYRQQNKEQKNVYYKVWERNRLQTDPKFRITQNIRRRIRIVLKGKTKSASTIKLLGCHPEFAKTHIEAQFQTGMSWDNYGEWHIDHITPCAVFNMEIKAHQHQCFHYTNLQPLWANENLSKGDKITERQHTYEACLERIKLI